MDGASILLMVAAFGVSFGWQPDPDDPRAYEVTAQIEPELLDVLKSGRSVPIEAHVPADVAPIRRIRVVVGSGTLARRSLDAMERVVRGQEPSPQSHTARLPEDNPWGNRYQTSATPPANSRQYDQRGATIGVQEIRTAQAPSPYDRARDAVVETGNAVATGASDFGRALDQQFRNFTGTTGQTSQSAPTTWPAPPPPPTTPLTGAAPTTGWTSIRPDLAPPRLKNPPLTPLVRTDSTLRVASNPSGPGFPGATSGDRAPLHSVLTDPAASASTPPDWAGGWGAVSTSSQSSTPPAAMNAAEEARWAWPTPSDSSNPPFASTPPPGAAASATGMSANTTTDNRYSQPTPTTSAPAPNDLWADFPPPPSITTTTTAPSDRYAPQPPTNTATPQTPPADTAPVIGVAPRPASSAAQTTPVGDQLPWMPLLAVSVALAGSLGANLFLGWSYADARHRYRNLVRKTTNSFHRAAGVAA